MLKGVGFLSPPLVKAIQGSGSAGLRVCDQYCVLLRAIAGAGGGGGCKWHWWRGWCGAPCAAVIDGCGLRLPAAAVGATIFQKNSCKHSRSDLSQLASLLGNRHG